MDIMGSTSFLLGGAVRVFYFCNLITLTRPYLTTVTEYKIFGKLGVLHGSTFFLGRLLVGISSQRVPM